jgi:4-amino-4-deoxy-L-arabinose transferase-like glycosyltransferase
LNRDSANVTRTAALIVVLVAVALAGIRLSAPPDLMMYDQERQASYVLDVLRNGHWMAQQDWGGEPASKPPLYNWLAALATLPFGRINRFSVCFPAVASTVFIALIIFSVGRFRFGWRAGYLGALAYLLTLLTARQMALVRTDGLFALTVTLAALAAYRAWHEGRGWTWFWLAAVAATLTKGPLGVALGAAGLLAVVWDWWSGYRVRCHGAHWLGIGLFVVLIGGWFALAYAAIGPALIDRFFVQELAGNAIRAHDMTVFPGRWFYKPPLYFLARFAPASLVAYFAFWRTWRTPAVDEEERRFERFLFCWFWGGIIFFCLGASQRADHLMPLVPAAALLAGRELARWTSRWTTTVVLRVGLVAAVVFLGVVYVDYNILERKEANITATIGTRELAAEIRAKLGDAPPLVHVDDPFALQFYLNTCRPSVSHAEAARLLRNEPPVFVAVRNRVRLESSLGTNGPALETVARWPDTDKPYWQVVTRAR